MAAFRAVDLLDGLGRLLADLVVEGDARRQIVEAARREGHVEVLGDRLLVHVDQLRGQLLVGHLETVAGARQLRFVGGDARLERGEPLRGGVVALDDDLHLAVERVDLALQLTRLGAGGGDGRGSM